MGTFEDQLVEACKAWSSRPKDYAYFGDNPDMFSLWGFSPISKHRDSDALGRANYDSLLEMLKGKYPDDTEVVRSNHWAVGWIDQLSIRVWDKDGKPSAVAREVFQAMQRLEEYAVWDDNLYSEYEYAELVELMEEVAREVSRDREVTPTEDQLAKATSAVCDNYGSRVEDISWKDAKEAILEAMGLEPVEEGEE